MSQFIKSFSIFKNTKKEKDTQPDYTISAKVQKNNVDEFKEIGGAWIKDTKTGQKFFSCMLNKPFTTPDGKLTVDGYVLVSQIEWEKMSQVYEDYLIKKDNPDYPTPTDLGIDLDKTLNISPEDLDNWEKDIM